MNQSKPHYTNHINKIMKRKLLFLPLLLCAVMVMAEQPLVPAMIVHGTDGNKQVVRLDATDVTDIIVLQDGQSLSVDIPESQISGVRSISFAMVDASEITAVESAEVSLVRGVEKVLRDGQVILRLQMQNGTILEYDIKGNQINNK